MQRAAESGHPTEPSPNDYHYIYVYERASYAHEVSDRHAKRCADDGRISRKSTEPQSGGTKTVSDAIRPHVEKNTPKKGRRRMFFHERFPTGLSQKWKFHLPTISLWKTSHGFPKRYPLDLQNFVKRIFFAKAVVEKWKTILLSTLLFSSSLHLIVSIVEIVEN